VMPPGAVEVGRRVFIRPLTVRDRDDFLALARASRTWLRPWVDPPADRRAFTAYLRRSRRPTERALLVCRREDGAGAPFMGKGYMSEGLRLVLRHAFSELGLHRLEANIQPANQASIRLVRRLGFRREGFSPRYLKVFGRWRDHVRWAVTVEDVQR
jgi:[ribosomal protein S5]-alanine N-acetyltransferase